MVTVCEGAKDVKSCLNAFTEQNNKSWWRDVVLGIGCVAGIGFVIYDGKIQKKVAQICSKQHTLALIIVFVALSVFLAVAHFLKATNLGLFICGGLFIGSLPYWIAKKVYPEKNVSIFK